MALEPRRRARSCHQVEKACARVTGERLASTRRSRCAARRADRSADSAGCGHGARHAASVEDEDEAGEGGPARRGAARRGAARLTRRCTLARNPAHTPRCHTKPLPRLTTSAPPAASPAAARPPPRPPRPRPPPRRPQRPHTLSIGTQQSYLSRATSLLRPPALPPRPRCRLSGGGLSCGRLQRPSWRRRPPCAAASRRAGRRGRSRSLRSTQCRT